MYYDTRARGSRIGAWASKQSKVLKAAGGSGGRAKMRMMGGRSWRGWVAETEKRFEGEEKIPIPEFWGGLRIVPERVEFWQGRQNRLHDRFVYKRAGGGDGGKDEWTLERLSP